MILRIQDAVDARIIAVVGVNLNGGECVCAREGGHQLTCSDLGSETDRGEPTHPCEGIVTNRHDGAGQCHGREAR